MRCPRRQGATAGSTVPSADGTTITMAGRASPQRETASGDRRRGGTGGKEVVQPGREPGRHDGEAGSIDAGEYRRLKREGEGRRKRRAAARAAGPHATARARVTMIVRGSVTVERHRGLLAVVAVVRVICGRSGVDAGRTVVGRRCGRQPGEPDRAGMQDGQQRAAEPRDQEPEEHGGQRPPTRPTPTPHGHQCYGATRSAEGCRRRPGSRAARSTSRMAP